MRLTLDSKLLARQKWCWLREPFPEPMLKLAKPPKNIARFALDVKDYFSSNPGASHSDAANHFKVTRPRISQLLKIANHLPRQLLREKTIGTFFLNTRNEKNYFHAFNRSDFRVNCPDKDLFRALTNTLRPSTVLV